MAEKIGKNISQEGKEHLKKYGQTIGLQMPYKVVDKPNGGWSIVFLKK
jgi:hypothetical protein